MPLSFVAILGGMITIIGSSTNLLVSDSLKTYSNIEIKLSLVAIPGSIIAFLWTYICCNLLKISSDR